MEKQHKKLDHTVIATNQNHIPVSQHRKTVASLVLLLLLFSFLAFPPSAPLPSFLPYLFLPFIQQQFTELLLCIDTTLIT